MNRIITMIGVTSVVGVSLLALTALYAITRLGNMDIDFNDLKL